MYVVEDGRLRSYADEEDGRRDHAYYRKGDFFGETSLLRGQPRVATVEAVSDVTLLEARRPALYRLLLDRFPEFRTKIDERVAQYEYRRLARVPLDFAEELLPAEVGGRERTEVAAEDAAVGVPEDVETFAGEPAAPKPRQAPAPLPARLPGRRDGLRRGVPGDGRRALRPPGEPRRASATRSAPASTAPA